MLTCLEERGYVIREAESGCYKLTLSCMNSATRGTPPACCGRRYLEGSSEDLPTSVEDAIHTITLVEACYESNHTGRSGSTSNAALLTKEHFTGKNVFMSLADLQRDFSLSGKVALVSGAGSGIGEAIARRLSQAGAHVIVADIDAQAAHSVAMRLPSARSVKLDVTDIDEVAACSSELEALHILINNAGVGSVGSIEHTSLDEFHRVMRVNVDSVFLMTRALLPQLLESRGSVVNIASVAGLVGIRQRFAYCASKGAVVAMSRQLAADYPQQLRVNCVCPGTIDSPFVAGFLKKFHSGEEETVREQLRARQPIGRLGRPEEVAALVAYLCSPVADFMQGSVLTIDGGWTTA